MIHEQICTYEVCKLAREKGFNVQTFDWYDYTGNYHKGFIPHELHECPQYKEYYAPTQSLLQRWLREEKGIMIEITIWLQSDGSWRYRYRIQTKEEVVSTLNEYNTYELALENALIYAFENMI